MAARTNKPFHDAETRKRIQTTQLINRLQDNALGKINLTKEQIRSIEILLKKTVPDLSSVDLTGQVNVTHEEALDALR